MKELKVYEDYIPLLPVGRWMMGLRIAVAPGSGILASLSLLTCRVQC